MSKLDFFNDNRLTVIPVNFMTKQPKKASWQKAKWQDNHPGDFCSQTNYGVVLGTASDGLVDIDLDCPSARALAPHFLPETGWVFGRKSAPRSHWLYRVDGDAGSTRKFDAAGKFAEYRANGAQTVFPPSVHETGEDIEFAQSTSPGRTTRDNLHRCLSDMAICGIVIPHHRPGSRHDLVMALSGTLLRHGRSEEDILRIVGAICELTGDQEATLRLRDVRDTAACAETSKPYTQGRALKEIIGTEAMQALQPYLGKPCGSNLGAIAGIAQYPLEDRNDSGVARRFAQAVKDKVLFDDAFSVYEDGIWRPDNHDLKVIALFDEFIKEQAKTLRTDVSGTADDNCASQLKFLQKYRDRPKAKHAIEQSRSYLRPANLSFDAHDDWIALRNGVLDLRTGELKSFAPEQYITKRTNVAFDPHAQCPNFRAVLDRSFGGDDDLIRYMQGLMGYWLTGRNDRQQFYIFHGTGANGKSSLINVIAHILGPYAGTMMSETVFESLSNQYSSDLAQLRGCRLAIAQEAESKFRLNAPRLKQLTGDDEIKVKALYKDPTSYRPKFKIIIVANKRPKLDAYDDALRRRTKLIPFEVTIPREDRDPRLGEKLKAEASGILNFMIEGARMYFRGEIHEPKIVRSSTDDYFNDHDSVGSFLSDRTVSEGEARCGKRQLYDAYESYCSEERMTSTDYREFSAILSKRGFADGRSNSERQWKGLRLLSPGDAEQSAFSVVSRLKLVE